MDKDLVIKAIGQTKLDNAMHVQYHTEMYGILQSADQAKTGLPADVMTEYNASLAQEVDINREAKADALTADLLVADRDRAVQYLFGVVRNATLSPDEATREAAEHIADLLEMDQKFAEQYYNYASGRISMLYGFEVYEYVAGPVYNLTGAKQALGTAPVVGSIYQASVAFHTSRVFKATGSTTFYYSEAKNDPQYQRSLVNYRHYFVVLPKKVEAIGAIISDKK